MSTDFKLIGIKESTHLEYYSRRGLLQRKAGLLFEEE